MIVLYVLAGLSFFSFLFWGLKNLFKLKTGSSILLTIYITAYILGAIFLYQFIDSEEKKVIYFLALTVGIAFRLFFFFKGLKSSTL